MSTLPDAWLLFMVLSVVMTLRLLGMSDADIRRLIEPHVPDYAKIERLERELLGESE